MTVKTMLLDQSRCIGCRACEAACRECDSHKDESMIMIDFADRAWSVATQPTLCMHCEDPVAPCAQVCPALAIQITPDGVVQQANPSLYRVRQLRVRMPRLAFPNSMSRRG